jgi:hypothetical protein
MVVGYWSSGSSQASRLRFRAEILHFTEASYSTCFGATIFTYIRDGPGLEYNGARYGSVLHFRFFKDLVHTFQQ